MGGLPRPHRPLGTPALWRCIGGEAAREDDQCNSVRIRCEPARMEWTLVRPCRLAASPPRRLAMITVQDLIDQALPKGTHVVAGETGLRRDVTWATRPRPSPPTFDHLSGGELVLLTPKVLQDLDERLTLEAAIHQLAGFDASAVPSPGGSPPARRPRQTPPVSRSSSSLPTWSSRCSSAPPPTSSANAGATPSGAVTRPD